MLLRWDDDEDDDGFYGVCIIITIIALYSFRSIPYSFIGVMEYIKGERKEGKEERGT